MSPAVFLTLIAMLPAAVPVLRTSRGEEWTYRGTVSEAVNRGDIRFRRSHQLEVRVLALDWTPTHSDLAVLTLLRREDDKVSDALSAVSGTVQRTPFPPAARLDVVRLEADGTARLLVSNQTAVPLPEVRLDSFSAFEFGMIPPRNLKAGTADFIAGEQCVPLVQTRQSPTWERPTIGQTAWRHVETAWVSTRDGTTRRVQRSIQQRDGMKAEPAIAIEVNYELEGQSRVLGREFERYRREIEMARTATREMAPLLPLAVKLGPRPFDMIAVRLDDYLRDSQPGTPYQDAVLSVRRRIDAAQKGEGVGVFSTRSLNVTATGSPNPPPVARRAVGP